MKRSKFSEGQTTYALRHGESGTAVADVYRQLGVSEAPFYMWRKKCAHLGVSELRRVRQLEDENNRLKRLVAELTLDKHILTETIRKTGDAGMPASPCRLDAGDLPDRRGSRDGWRPDFSNVSIRPVSIRYARSARRPVRSRHGKR